MRVAMRVTNFATFNWKKIYHGQFNTKLFRVRCFQLTFFILIAFSLHLRNSPLNFLHLCKYTQMITVSLPLLLFLFLYHKHFSKISSLLFVISQLFTLVIRDAFHFRNFWVVDKRWLNAYFILKRREFRNPRKRSRNECFFTWSMGKAFFTHCRKKLVDCVCLASPASVKCLISFFIQTKSYSHFLDVYFSFQCSTALCWVSIVYCLTYLYAYLI